MRKSYENGDQKGGAICAGRGPVLFIGVIFYIITSRRPPSFYMITLNARPQWATVGTAAENNEKISLTSEPWAASADTLLFSGKPKVEEITFCWQRYRLWNLFGGL